MRDWLGVLLASLVRVSWSSAKGDVWLLEERQQTIAGQVAYGKGQWRFGRRGCKESVGSTRGNSSLADAIAAGILDTLGCCRSGMLPP